MIPLHPYVVSSYMGMLMLETPPPANTSFVWTGCDTAAETRDIETRSTAPLLVGRLPCGGIRSRWRCTQPLCTTPAPRRERLEALRRFTFFAMLRRHYFDIHLSARTDPPVRIDACQQLKSKPLFHDNDLNRLSKKKMNPAPIHQPMTSHSSTRAPLASMVPRQPRPGLI